jgi:hypothetical protein
VGTPTEASGNGAPRGEPQGHFSLDAVTAIRLEIVSVLARGGGQVGRTVATQHLHELLLYDNAGTSAGHWRRRSLVQFDIAAYFAQSDAGAQAADRASGNGRLEHFSSSEGAPRALG